MKNKSEKKKERKCHYKTNNNIFIGLMNVKFSGTHHVDIVGGPYTLYR